MNLENLKVQELSLEDQMEIDGGGLPLILGIAAAIYLGAAFIEQNQLR